MTSWTYSFRFIKQLVTDLGHAHFVLNSPVELIKIYSSSYKELALLTSFNIHSVLYLDYIGDFWQYLETFADLRDIKVS